VVVSNAVVGKAFNAEIAAKIRRLRGEKLLTAKSAKKSRKGRKVWARSLESRENPITTEDTEGTEESTRMGLCAPQKNDDRGALLRRTDEEHVDPITRKLRVLRTPAPVPLWSIVGYVAEAGRRRRPQSPAPRLLKYVPNHDKASIIRKIVSRPRVAPRMLCDCLRKIVKRPYTSSM
jgi:hypothetical protein